MFVSRCSIWYSVSRVLQEIAAIKIAICTFAPELAGRKVVLYSDNVGAEKATAKGSARAFDHNDLVHSIWSFALHHKVRLWVERVPSKYNISDSPSRFQYKIMEDIGAEWRRADLDSAFALQ